MPPRFTKVLTHHDIQHPRHGLQRHPALNGGCEGAVKVDLHLTARLDASIDGFVDDALRQRLPCVTPGLIAGDRGQCAQVGLRQLLGRLHVECTGEDKHGIVEVGKALLIKRKRLVGIDLVQAFVDGHHGTAWVVAAEDLVILVVQLGVGVERTILEVVVHHPLQERIGLGVHARLFRIQIDQLEQRFKSCGEAEPLKPSLSSLI